MKKISLFLILAMFCFAPSLMAFDDPTFENQVKLKGIGSGQAAPTRVVKLVRFVNRGPNVDSLLSGDAVIYSMVSDDGVSVNTTTTSADGAFAGIVATTIQTADGASTQASDDIGRRNWGWIVVHGFTTAKVSAGGTNGNAAGDFFITSADSGAVTTMMANTAGAAQNSEMAKVVRGAGGFFLDAADTTSTSVEVFVENV